MKKFTLSFAVTFLFAFYAVATRVGGSRIDYIAPGAVADAAATAAPETSTVPTTASAPPTPVATPVSKPKPKPIATPAPAPAPAPVPPPAPVATKPKGKYLDGTYTGSVADAYYGNIQVQAIIQNGALADVVFLQYPNDRGTSIEINSQAMPMLKQEALQVQSANVDGVSGATDSSAAFRESLGNALSQALNS